MNETMIVEINGVKLEIDTRTARRVDTLRVGSRVKILIKAPYDSVKYKVHPGVVVGFDAFTDLPTITVAYMELDYSGAKLKWVAINAQQADIQMVAATDDDQLELSRDETVEKFDREIANKTLELDELESQKKFFLARFGEYFSTAKTEQHA